MNPVSQIISSERQLNKSNTSIETIKAAQSFESWNQAQTGSSTITAWQQDLLVQMELS